MNAVPASAEKRHYQFDQFRVDPVRRLLLRDGELVPLTPKVFAILLVLLERRGEVVDKKELIQQVWPDTFVTEANLTQNISTLRKVLGERAGDRRFVVTLPGRGYSFVAEVTEALPATLPEELPKASAVTASAVPSPPEMPRVRRFHLRAAGLGIAVLAVIAAMAAAFLWFHGHQPAPRQESLPRVSAATRRPSIAVLGFRNLSGNEQVGWLAPALAEMLSNELGASERVRLISGEAVAQARQSLGLPYTDSLDTGSLHRLQQLLGAERAVLGSYVALGDGKGRRLRLDLRVVDLASGEGIAGFTESGTEAGLFDLVSRAGARLRRELGMVEPSPEQIQSLRALHPVKPEGARLYAEGLVRLRSYDFPGARDLLIQAARSDPSSPFIHAELSRVWMELGYDKRALEEARQALALSRSLPRAEHLALEARFHEASRQWDKAAELHRSLWTFFPDEVKHGLGLAKALNLAGKSREALEVIQALRQMPVSDQDAPQIDFAEAIAATRLSDPALGARAAELAITHARRAGGPAVVARALVLQGGSLLAQGKTQESLGPLREARQLYEGAGHPLGVILALSYLGNALFIAGDLDAAEAAHLEVLAQSRKVGSVLGMTAGLGNLGRIHMDLGNLDRAYEYLEKSRAYFQEIRDPLLRLRILSFLGTILSIRGDLENATERTEETITLSRELGSRLDEGRALSLLAAIEMAQGRIEDARQHSEQALQVLSQTSYPSESALARCKTADVLVRLGELPLARQRYERSLAISREVDNKIAVGEILGSLARLDLLEGKVESARRRSEEQLEVARSTGVRGHEAMALWNLGAAELAAGDEAKARLSLEAALSTGRAAGVALQTAAVRLDLARLDLTTGRSAEAARAAREVAAWAAGRGAGSLAGEAFALTASALLRRGDPAGARAAAAQALERVEQSDDRQLRILMAPALARTEAAGGGGSGALRPLRQAVDEAAQLGFVVAGLEARWTLAELELLHGDPAKARRALDAVRRDAEARGLRRLATLAGAAGIRIPDHPGRQSL
jgi:DNA-binding winged helix-turn-helix (wHTH) protein/tetratricopeptide (TPR) repeat protein